MNVLKRDYNLSTKRSLPCISNNEINDINSKNSILDSSKIKLTPKKKKQQKQMRVPGSGHCGAFPFV